MVSVPDVIKAMSGYFQNLRDASKENETLCVLLKTIEARLINNLWELDGSDK